jgi:hypothetical protein
LESIWVAPIYRYQGVCRDLVQALADRERRMGAIQLLLWVLDGNHDALRAYEALGFQPIGKPQFLRAFGRWEQQLGVQISCLTQPMPTAGSLSLDHGPSFQPQEIHRFHRVPDVVYGV